VGCAALSGRDCGDVVVLGERLHHRNSSASGSSPNAMVRNVRSKGYVIVRSLFPVEVDHLSLT